MKNLTVALLADGLYTWDGGTDFLSNIACVFQFANKYVDYSIKMYLVIPREYFPLRIARRLIKKWDLGEKKNIERVTSVFSVLCPEISVVFYRKHIKRIYDDKGKSLDKTLKKIGADICFPVLRDYYPQIKTPWIGYIADFQEKYLPELFDEATLTYRENNSKRQVQNTKFFIATSESVKNDLEHFYPGDYKVFVQPFAPFAPKAFIECAIDISKYNLPRKYFIISNQFWIHKNHMTAIKAMKQVVDAGYNDVGLVCTGRMYSDDRDGEYCDELKKMVEELQLEKNVFFVGFIPKMDQIQMIKDSVALIQPSLFEGDPGGCSVYNAYSLMVPSIMADIRVNNEVGDSELIRHFEAKNSKNLADEMKLLLEGKRRTVGNKELNSHNSDNIKVLAEFYLSMVEEVISNY
ncbi:MAG: glycosyltransferase family 4 protein [Butyrivibrio sp.]|nr:glycosyltransferase family 4 protein [Butyrivibrio sp.]